MLCETIDEAIAKVVSTEEVPQPSEATAEGAENVEKKKRPLPPLVYNMFSLLSYIVCQPGGKAAFLNVMSSTPECVSEFPTFIANAIALQGKEPDWYYLENCLLPLIQSICDHQVCLTSFNEIITLQHLSNNLPVGESLNSIVELCCRLVENETLPLPLLMRCLDTLESLTDHDYGMQYIENCLNTKGKKYTPVYQLQTNTLS